MATKKVTQAEAEAMTPRQIAAMLKQKFVQAATEVANDAHAESVTASIISDLNAQKRVVTLKLLGLDDKWGDWEVDHCNGRNSPVTEYLAQGAKEEIKKWVNDAVKEVLTTELKSKVMLDAKKAIKKEVDGIIASNLNGYNLREYAKPVIDSWLEQAANEVRKELGIRPSTGEDE